jgi:hypothetical protein
VCRSRDCVANFFLSKGMRRGAAIFSFVFKRALHLRRQTLSTQRTAAAAAAAMVQIHTTQRQSGDRMRQQQQQTFGWCYTYLIVAALRSSLSLTLCAPLGGLGYSDFCTHFHLHKSEYPWQQALSFAKSQSRHHK